MSCLFWGADIQVSDVFMGKYCVNVHFQLLFVRHESNSSEEETQGRLKHLSSLYQVSATSRRSITVLSQQTITDIFIFRKQRRKHKIESD